MSLNYSRFAKDAEAAGRLSDAIDRGAKGARWAEGAREPQLLWDASCEAAEQGEDGLALALRTLATGRGSLSPADYRQAMVASRAIGAVAGSKGVDVAKPTTLSNVKAPATAAAPKQTKTYSASDVALAAEAAKNAERARWATVFASEHSRGRERGCVTLLTASRGWSGAHIASELAHMPTDTEIGGQTSRGSSDAVWDRAYAGSEAAQRILAAQRGTKPRSPQAERILAAQSGIKAASPQAERILAAQRGTKPLSANAERVLAAQKKVGATDAKLRSGDAGAVWDRAYSRASKEHSQ